MKQPTFTGEGLISVQKYLLDKQKLKLLDRPEDISVIKTGCPTLDWVTDCGGIPRGRIVEISGPESSGKCVSLDTFVPTPDRGICTVEELIRPLPWTSSFNPSYGNYTTPDQKVFCEFLVHTTEEEPTVTHGAYYAGYTDTMVLHTEMGHHLRGTIDHRVLILPENGILRWTHLKDARPGDLIVGSIGHKAAGEVRVIAGMDMPSDDPLEKDYEKKIANAKLLGALAAVEMRMGEPHLLFISSRQRKYVEDWAIIAAGSDAAPFDESQKKFTKISGIARLRSGCWQELALRILREVAPLIRRASLTAQISFAAGLTLTRGAWTGNDLEFEIENLEVGEVLHVILENLGIKALCYGSLNTFAQPRKKIALYDRLAQQIASKLLWKDITLPAFWEKKYIDERSETHDGVTKTLERAREILKRSLAGVSSRVLVGASEHSDEFPDLSAFDLNSWAVDVEDTEKDNLEAVAEFLRPFCKNRLAERVHDTLRLLSKENVTLDRVTNVVRDEAVPTADLFVPIGSHYATNGLVSHNSTLCMHICNQEMTQNPGAVCVYQDYERSTATNYARKMGLHTHKDSRGSPRFHLIPSDIFEEADDLVNLYFKSGVFPAIWVCDSVPAMVPRAMFEMEADDNPQVALQARKFADLLSKWVKYADDYGTVFLMVNQIRAYIKMGFTDPGARATPGVAGSEKESSPGGNAIKFYSSLRMDLRPKSIMKAKVFNPMTGSDDEIPVANLVKATAKKNKAGAPYRSGTFFITFGEGVDTIRTMVELGLQRKFIVKSGQSFVLQGDDAISARGYDQFLQLVRSDKRIQTRLESLLQWDKAEEVVGKVIGVTIEDVETGEIKEDVSRMTGDVASGKLRMAQSQNDVMGQADVLGLLSKDGRAVIWTNPNTNQSFRGAHLGSLGSKIRGGDRLALQELVNAKMVELSASLEPVSQTAFVSVNSDVKSENPVDAIFPQRVEGVGTDLGGQEENPGDSTNGSSTQA